MDLLGKHSYGLSSPRKYNYVEELIALVDSPSKDFHDLPPCEIIFAQEAPREHSHQLKSMRLFGITVGCRPGIFQTSGEQRYEEWLLQGVKNEMPARTVSVDTI
jgi:hypothetical protein